MSLHEGADQARPDTPNRGGWATFEARVRARRVGTCLERARELIDAGSLEEARRVLDEARLLIPDAPEIVELEHGIAAQPSRGAVLPPAGQVPVESSLDWQLVAAIAIVVGLFFLGGLSVVKFWHRFTGPEVLSTSGLSSAPDTVTESRTATRPATAAAPPEASEPARVAVDTPTIKVAPVPPATRSNRRAQPPGALERSRTPAASTAATTIRRKSPSPRPPVNSQPQPPTQSGTVVRPEVKPLVEARPFEAVALERTSTGAQPMATLDPPVSASSATSNGESRYDESLRIRAVLLRYETAYNRLDAMAARAVWPGVNESALKRAFSGLVSQKVSLGPCDITVIGDIAGASCAGKARWEPKIGGGLQTADRYWTFQLRKSAEGWRIKEVLVR